MGWIQQQMNLDVNPEDILAYMIPHAQLVSQYYIFHEIADVSCWDQRDTGLVPW